MKTLIATAMLMTFCAVGWAQEDCRKTTRFISDAQQCRIANALERIAEALEKGKTL